MKKLVSLILALALVMSVCAVNVFADDAALNVYWVLAYDAEITGWNADWDHSSGDLPGGPFPGEVKEYTITVDWSTASSADYIWLGVEDKPHYHEHEFTYTLSDITFKSGGKDYVVKGGDYSVNAGQQFKIAYDVADICGSTSFGDKLDFVKSLTEIDYTITYTSHDGVKADAAPVDDNNTTSESPVDTAVPTDTTEPAETGIALAMLPIAIAAAAVAVSKKRQFMV